MNKQITSIDVAELAGVSQSTVSRVFSSNSPRVAEATRQKVLEAANALGYRPNAIARMMSSRHTRLIGIVMASITSPFYPYVLDKFLQRLQATDHQVLLFTAAENQAVDELLPLVLQHRVDALVITSALLSSSMADECARAGTPVLLFNRYVPGANVSAVCADNIAGGRMAADVLLDSGHERLAYVAGTQDTSTNIDRERGFRERLQERAVTTWRRAQGAYTYETGVAAAQELLREEPPDAIFCANDIMALGVLDALRAAGLRVPQDVSVIGFDDIPMAAWQSYQLTTISQEVEAMIARSIEILLERIVNPEQPPTQEFIAGELRIRSTVRNLKSE